MNLITKIAVGIGSVTLLAGCTYGAPDPNTASTQTSETPSATQEAADVEAARTIRVEVGEFFFSPNEFDLTAGETIEFELVNVGTMRHTFTIPDLGVDVSLNKGATEKVKITPSEPGSYELLCTIIGHASRGQTGTVTVN